MAPTILRTVLYTHDTDWMYIAVTSCAALDVCKLKLKSPQALINSSTGAVKSNPFESNNAHETCYCQSIWVINSCLQ